MSPTPLPLLVDLNDLITAAIFFFIFVLPVLRSITESRKRHAGEARQRELRERRRRATEREQTGGDLFEQLLRGEVPREAPPPPPPPPRPVARPPPPPPAPRPIADAILERKPVVQPPPRQVSLEEEPPEPLVDFERLGMDAGAPPAQPMRPRALAPTRRGPFEVRRAGDAAATFRLEPGELRRAVLLSEIFSPPVSMRGGRDAFPGAAPGL